MPQLGKDIPAIRLGHHHVQKDDFWLIFFDQTRYVAWFCHAGQGLASSLRIALKEMDRIEVIIGDQHRSLG